MNKLNMGLYFELTKILDSMPAYVGKDFQARYIMQELLKEYSVEKIKHAKTR